MTVPSRRVGKRVPNRNAALAVAMTRDADLDAGAVGQHRPQESEAELLRAADDTGDHERTVDDDPHHPATSS